MRNRFDNQLAELNNELISMGALCENAIASAVKSLIDGDTKLAAAAIRIDHEIDRKEREIESMCLKLLLQQQPVASDLRLISSVLKMITDIERIGDQASDIAEIVTCLSGACGHNAHIDQMAQATIKMVTDSLDAFVRRDLTLAWSVIEYDDVVDRPTSRNGWNSPSPERTRAKRTYKKPGPTKFVGLSPLFPDIINILRRETK